MPDAGRRNKVPAVGKRLVAMAKNTLPNIGAKKTFVTPRLLSDVVQQAKQPVGKFRPANYIRALDEVDPLRSGLALANPSNGDVVAAGDADVPVSIQSVSKLFNAVLLGMHTGFGNEPGELWDVVGTEATGEAFNSHKMTAGQPWKPMNPCVNAGAVAVMNGVCEQFPADEHPENRLRDFLRELAGDNTIEVDDKVAQSELGDANNNKELLQELNVARQAANTEYGLQGARKFPPVNVDRVLEAYCRQCAITMTPRQMAKALWTLEHGKNAQGQPYLDKAALAKMKAVIGGTGAYDQAITVAAKTDGKVSVKTGVGGLIAGWIKGKDGKDIPVCTFSPPLNTFGNSKEGISMLGTLARLDLAFPSKNMAGRLVDKARSSTFAPKESPQAMHDRLFAQLSQEQQDELTARVMVNLSLSPGAMKTAVKRNELGFFLKAAGTKDLPRTSKPLYVATGADGVKRTYSMIDGHHLAFDSKGGGTVKGGAKIVVSEVSPWSLDSIDIPKFTGWGNVSEELTA